MRAALVCVVLLTACRQLEVHDMSNGQHSLTATAASGGYSGSHEEAVEQANVFCSRYGQAAVVDGFYDKSTLGPDGEHSSSVIFSCAARKPLKY